MSNPPNALAPTLYHHRATGLAYSHAFTGTGTPKTTPGSGASSRASRLLASLLALCATSAILIAAATPAGAEPLPDGRVYEMVTPPGNQNADAYVQNTPAANDGITTELPFQAAADGDAVTYAGGPTSGGNGSAGPGSGNQYLAKRSPSGGWTQSALPPPGTITGHIYYQAFSNELSVGIVNQFGEQTPLSPAVTALRYDVLYAHDFEDSVYRPFFTQAPPDRARYEFHTAGYALPSTEAELLLYAGSSANLEHLLFEANDAMSVNPLGGVMPVDGGEEENNLYDSVGGQLQLVNVLPNGSSEPNATFGAPRLSSNGHLGDQADFSHAISADGGRIIWTDLNTHDLYVRENDTQPQSPLGAEDECLVSSDACTVQVDASALPGTEKEKEEKGGGGRFWTASGDGSRVFFTDCSRLTGESTSMFSAGCSELLESKLGIEDLRGNDLYEYDFEKPGGAISMRQRNAASSVSAGV